MMSNFFRLFVGLCLVGTVAASALREQSQHQEQRELQFDSLFPTDLCKNGPGWDDIGPCDLSKFPICGLGEVRCYNRKVWRDKFHTDNKQPMYYIDYGLVLCYKEGVGMVCSSCSPGRFCKAENRCVLDEIGYPCAEWF